MDTISMPDEPPIAPSESGITFHPPTGLVGLPGGCSSALAEIISCSLTHIQTNTTLAASERRAGDEQEFEIAPGVTIVMCWIPPGKFLMGSPEDELGRRSDEVEHLVTLTQGFWLGKYQVTQAQWYAVMGNNPSCFRGLNLPVENISWNDISQSYGFLETVNRDYGASGIFSLPTEAQWEYACRAGTLSALNNGKNLASLKDDCSDLDEVAWYRQNSRNTTHPVGQKKGNAWGLQDMHGNVWEWCADWFGDYVEDRLIDPQGPDSGSARVLRGGGWYFSACRCRSAYRVYGLLHYRYNYLGFRLARSSGPYNQRLSEQSSEARDQRSGGEMGVEGQSSFGFFDKEC